MNNKIKQALFYLLILTISICLITACSADSSNTDASGENPVIGTVSVSVSGYEDMANLSPIDIELTEGMTALDALYCTDFVIVNSDGFVTSVDGLKNGMEGYPYSGWIYTVNGEFATVGASKYILKDADVVEWKYILTFE